MNLQVLSSKENRNYTKFNCSIETQEEGIDGVIIVLTAGLSN